MILGRELVSSLKSMLSEQNAGFLNSYFEANEYGEAIDFLDCIIDQHGLSMPSDAERMLIDIKNAISEIGRLYRQ